MKSLARFKTEDLPPLPYACPHANVETRVVVGRVTSHLAYRCEDCGAPLIRVPGPLTLRGQSYIYVVGVR